MWTWKNWLDTSPTCPCLLISDMHITAHVHPLQVRGYTAVKRQHSRSKAASPGRGEGGLQYKSHGHNFRRLPPSLIVVSLFGPKPLVPHSRGIVLIFGGSRSSALLCTQSWFSWGRWWWCSWSSAADGEAGTPAVSYSGARYCLAWPWWSVCSARDPDLLAAGPHSEWSGGLSRSARTRCILFP